MNLFTRGIAKVGGLVLGGVTISPTGTQINLMAQGVAAGYKIARGQLGSCVGAADTVSTGLASVVAAIASLEDSPVIGNMWTTAVIGDQAGTPAAGSIYIKSWKPTGTADATPVAATTFGKKINWIAIGTVLALSLCSGAFTALPSLAQTV